MAKRLSKENKEIIIKCFNEGEIIDDISEKFECSKLTITRNLKKYFGESKFKELINKRKSNKESINSKGKSNLIELNNENNQDVSNKNFSKEKKSADNPSENEFFKSSEFMEIVPLNEDFDNASRKDLSSISIEDIDLPQTVYMIVNNKIELETKLLKYYAEWQFLSSEDLNREVIQIFYDLKNAKRNCNKDQKVIKVPNTNVFKIVSPILISRGITRIISEDQLIAL